jgi:hypothetical protein
MRPVALIALASLLPAGCGAGAVTKAPRRVSRCSPAAQRVATKSRLTCLLWDKSSHQRVFFPTAKVVPYRYLVVQWGYQCGPRVASPSFQLTLNVYLDPQGQNLGDIEVAWVKYRASSSGASRYDLLRGGRKVAFLVSAGTLYVYAHNSCAWRVRITADNYRG